MRCLPLCLVSVAVLLCYSFTQVTCLEDGSTDKTKLAEGMVLGSVGNITVDEEGTDYVTISWSEPPADNKSYVVEWKAINEGGVSNKTVIDTVMSWTIGELDPGTEYFISVAACISCSSDSPEIGEKSNTTARTLLEAPGDFKISDQTVSSISVEWTGDVEEEYLVRCFAVNSVDAPSVNCSKDGTTAICDGLTPGTLYNVTIETVKDGFLMESCGSECWLTNGTDPEAVYNLTATALSASVVQVRWFFDKDTQGNYSYFELTYQPGGTLERFTEAEDVTDVTGLDSNTFYTFTMTTYSNFSTGEVEQSEPKSESTLTMPDPVQNVSVSTQGPESLLVSWIPADTADENITHYAFTVTDKDDGNRCVKTVIIPIHESLELPKDLPVCEGGKHDLCDSHDSCVVDDLEGCTNYIVAMYVYNSAGGSDPEEAESATAIADVMDQIENFTQVSSTPNSVGLSWSAPAKPGKCDILFYKLSVTFINCEDETEEWMIDENITEMNYEIPDLPEENWNYTVYIQAFTRDNGDGTDSTQSTIATTNESAPGEPEYFNATEIESFTAKLMWGPPVFCDQNGQIRGYMLYYNCTQQDEDNFGETHKEPYASDDNEAEIPLHPFQTCRFYLRAITTQQGNISYAEVNTSQSTPGRVGEIRATTNESAVRLNWDPPENPNGVIILYTVTWNEVGTVTDTDGELSDNATSTSYDVTGLKAYTTYSISITAWTEIGSGDPEYIEANTTVSEPEAATDIDIIPSVDSFNVTWNKPDDKSGPTNYIVKACIQDVDGCDVTDSCEETVAEGFDTTTAEIFGLIPNWEYSVSVTAVTEAGNKTSDIVLGTTLPTNPPAIRDFRVFNSSENCAIFIAKWSALLCQDSKANIADYIIEVTNKETDEMTQRNITAVPRKSTYTEHIDVSAESSFDIEIYAYGDNLEGQRTNGAVSTGSCAPLLPEGDNATVTSAVVPSDSQTDNPQRQYIIELSPEFLNNSDQGEISDKGYIVVEAEYEEMEGQEFLTPEELEVKYGYTWKEVQEFSITPPYRATSKEWEPEAQVVSRKRAVMNNYVEDVVGEDENCENQYSYCNGFLKAGTSYRVKVFSCTESNCTLTAYSTPFATDPVEDDSDNSTTDIAVGVTVPLVLLLIIGAVVGVIIYRRNFYNKHGSTRKHAEQNGLTVVVASRDNQGFEMDEPPKPVLKEDFYDHVQRLRKDSDLLFSEEYKLLRDMSPRMEWEVAEMPQNRVKNRYTNILAYDHSRVKLLPTEDDEEGSDYINANYMPGYNSKREFIAAQGPLPSTKDDFWRMVWEQNVPVIVMLTKCYERGRLKCDQYWPNDTEPVFYGDLQVQVKSESVLDHYTIRIIDIKLGEKTHIVKQFHFTTWPDMGSPDTTDALLSFVKAVRSHMKPDMVGPMLVHCSAGVGRTGTFICVDTLLHQIVDHDTIDIFGMVLDLRKYRTNIVQTEDQYIYIHECMKDALKRGIMLKPSVYQHDELPEYDNVGTTDIQLEEALYENVEIRQPDHVMHEESDPEEDRPLKHDADFYEEDRV